MFNRACFRGLICAFAALSISPAFAVDSPAKHVLIISVDGLHQADLHDAALARDMPNILALMRDGVEYSRASCGGPSDSFPGTAAYITGAGPKTTGIYFDDSYSRSLRIPDSTPDSPAGAPVPFTGAIDKDPERLDGGGDSGLASIDKDKLPLALKDGKLVPIYPHDYILVNTIFEVAHEAGMRTAVIDKHPCYDIANGPSGKGVDDLYGPESDAKLALINDKLVDGSTFKQTASTVKLKKLTKEVDLSNGFDDLRMVALLNLIQGKDTRGSSSPGMPALIAINLVTLNTAQKLPEGGIDRNADGTEGQISQSMHEAMSDVDDNIGKIVKALKDNKLYDSTMIILTAKHAQGCRLGSCITLGVNTFTGTLEAHGVQVAQATEDDVGVYWLRNQRDTAKAAAILSALPPENGIDEVISGSGMVAAGFGDPARDDRTPDIIIKFKPGYLVHDKLKRAEHGGFSDDDTHVALVAAGCVPASARGTTLDGTVKSTQIAVSAIEALGLDPAKLQGARIENTPPLPGLK